MKNSLLIITLLFTCFVFGQKNEFNLIKLDSTWGQEVIRFPARNINYVGVGDIRFPPKGWINPEHTFFWSYTYAWSIDVNRKIPADELASNLEKYFNSLNRIDFNDKTNKNRATAVIKRIKKRRKITFYEGTIATYDRFATNKRFTLNVKIESHYCKKAKKTIILFKFSPKEFTHKVWQTLDKIELEKRICN